MEALVVWAPVFLVAGLFIGIGLWMSQRQMRKYGEHVDDVKSINDELVAANREMVAELREIKQILKDRT